MTTDHHDHSPNHHAHHPGFAGPKGLVAAVAMAVHGRHRARLAVRLAGVGAGDTAVDVGSGPGGAVRGAARTGATAIGVEPSRVMRFVAQVLSLARRGTRYVDGTAEAVPLADGTATVVWSVATVHHWQDVNAGISEARRLLRPGGRFLAVERHTVPGAQGSASHGWTPAQAESFADHCRAVGFEDIRVEQHRAGDMDVLAVLATAPTM